MSSDCVLLLDHFAGWAWTIGDYCRPASERIWAGAKFVGAGIIVAGGPLSRGIGKGLSAGARLLRGGGGAGLADGLGAAPKLLGTARDNLLEAATNPKLRNAISELYREVATIGNGSSMDALRAEGSQLLKVLERRTQMMRLLRKSHS